MIAVRTWFWLGALAAGIALWSGLALTPAAPPMAQTPATAAPSDRLLAWPLAELAALDIEHAGRRARIERAANLIDWRYAEGAPSAMDAQQSTRFLRAHLDMFSAARIERRFPLAAAQAEYGFEGSTFRLRLFSATGHASPRELRFGARTPDGFGQYVALAHTQEVAIVPAYHVANLAELVGTPAP
jgi:hypothetical protein